MKCRLPVVVAVPIALVLSGCGSFGSDSPALPAKQVDAQLHTIAAAPAGDRVYFLGKRFEKLQLTGMHPKGSTIPDTFVYGTCHLPAGEGGCTPPLYVEDVSPVVLFGGPAGCRRLAPIRGVPAVRLLERGGGDHGLTLFTGEPLTMLTIHAHDDAQEERAAAALRAVGGTSAAQLPAPGATDIQRIDKTCGTKPGRTVRPAAR